MKVALILLTPSKPACASSATVTPGPLVRYKALRALVR